jgi:DNA-binding transcriptional regulator YiaG
MSSKTCTNCNVGKLESIEPSIFSYDLSGLHVVLKGGVIQHICSNCGEKSLTIKNLPGLHRVIAEAVATANHRLSGAELRFLREFLGYSGDEMAHLVDLSHDTIRKAESGAQKVPKPSYELFLRSEVLRGAKAPDYEMRKLLEAKFKIEELKFVNRNKEWAVA